MAERYMKDSDGLLRDSKGNIVYTDFFNVNLYRITFIIDKYNSEWTANIVAESFQDMVNYLNRRFGNIKLSMVDKMGIEIHAITDEVQLKIADRNFNKIRQIRAINQDIQDKIENDNIDIGQAMLKGTKESGNIMKQTVTQPRVVTSTKLNLRRSP